MCDHGTYRHHPCFDCGGCCATTSVRCRRCEGARRHGDCHLCADVDLVLASTADPEVAAERLGRSLAALSKHFYRHGRRDLGRFFNRPDYRARYQRRKAAA